MLGSARLKSFLLENKHSHIKELASINTRHLAKEFPPMLRTSSYWLK